MQSDWGPFYGRWTDVHANTRTRALGPVYEKIETPEDWQFHAVRPFQSLWDHEGDRVERREVLWPVAKASRRGDARSWRFLLTWGMNWDVEDPESRHRLWVLPFYFHGRDTRGEDYRAIFPLGGRLHEFFLWDEIHFVLFPLYVESRKNEIEAKTVLWPLLSRTEGPGVRRARFFPFYGYNEREGFGRKHFVLWPFWTQVQYTMPENEGRGWILFPITGHLKLEDQESWWILPPLFRYHVGEEKNRLLGPWPFVQLSEGSTEKFYLWPLYGTKTIGSVQRDFYLWPLIWNERIDGPDTIKRRFTLVPFVQNFHEANAETDETESRYTKLWPLASHLYHAEGPVRRTVFPDLNPFRAGPIERNYAPFWQLFVREQVGEEIDTEILWGMYRSIKRGDDFRHRSLFPLVSWGREADGRSFSLLKGLFGYERAASKKSWRLLYLFRFGDTKQIEESRP